MRFSSLSKAVKGADLVAVLVCHDVLKRELTNERQAIDKAMRRKKICFFDE
jgi:hypothetical protein